ncbi:MAG: hypothetical protein GY810_06675 [Aureispira sp.]|nr:hypothetical protein [Aureispira sp.]
MKIGLWLPPRKDLNQPITPENPAHIDARIYDMFTAHLEERGIDYVENVDFRKAWVHNNKVYTPDLCVSDLDHLVWMGMIDRAYDSYDMEILRTLSLDVKLHHSYRFFSTATDKFLAFSELHKHGVPVSEIYLINPHNYGLFEDLLKDATYLLKPRRSHFGTGIIKIHDYEQLRDTIDYTMNKHYYLERFYENDLKDWIGITVVNGEVIYGFKKDSNLQAGWKIFDKDHKGGQTYYAKPNEEQIAIAKRIGELMGANCFGLDIIDTPEGYIVVDINCSPGIYYDFIQDLNIDIAQLFFKMI